MKRMLLTLAALAGAVLLALPAQAHDVKDPVCRMMVDSDTAKFTHKLGNKTFYFCSKACEAKFKTAPEKYEKLADQLEKQDLHEYTVDFRTLDEPVAGKPVRMEILPRYADTREPVKEFELVHERLMHFVMTSDDLSWFEHQHPVRGSDGVFRLTWTFPRAGSYRLYADFTPSDGDNQVLPVPLTVGGGESKSYPLTPDTKLVKQVGDLRFELKLQGAPFRMEKPVLMTYVVRDRNGRPVRDVQPYIGAMGHLLALSQNGKEFVHTHVLQSVTHPAMGEREPFRVTSAMVTEKGPAFSFKLTLPTSGLYKTWAQFMWRNRVYTVPFTFAVQDLWAKAPAGAVTTATRTRGGAAVQRATVLVDGGYSPAAVRVRAGRPVELTFLRKEKSGCGNLVRFPSLGIKHELKTGVKTTIRFTPKKSGTVPFTCAMGMYEGKVLVK